MRAAFCRVSIPSGFPHPPPPRGFLAVAPLSRPGTAFKACRWSCRFAVGELMTVFWFVLLTIGVFALLGVIVRGVEKL